MCNARAAAPGFTPAQEETVSFDDLPKEELGSVKEEPSEGHNDSEQGMSAVLATSCKSCPPPQPSDMSVQVIRFAERPMLHVFVSCCKPSGFVCL